MLIRTRLTLLFLLLGGIIMIVASVAIYYSSAGYRKVAFNNRLVDKANSTTMLITEPNRVLEIDTYNPDKLFNEKILIFNSFDNVVYTTDYKQEIEGSPEILEKIRSGEKLFYKQDQFEIIGKLYTVKNDNFIIIVAATDKDGHLYLEKLRVILILVCLISLLLFFAAGWIYSGRALKPISDVIKKVDDITITSLNLRVNEGNGKDEIGRLAKTFNRVLERLEASFALQKDFIANASHELRTPLTAINGHLDVLLMKDRSPQEYKDELKSVHDDIKAMIDLSNRLLMIARTRAEGPDHLNKKIRIDEIIWQAREELLRFKKDYHIHISLNDSLTDCEQMVVVGDESLLKVAVSNLMDNACKYSVDHSVHVALHYTDKQIKILFEDKGIGISEKDLEKVFEPFYRGSNALSHAAGSGIGLPLVNQIIRNYNGKIEIKSDMDSGTTVAVILPTN
ncbi:MAG: HAMP domain-containing histidine kinase [Bacteroidales bacterium]|nr:HAMP domain-containing histidine kinase [Bacteroidales bacterium]